MAGDIGQVSQAMELSQAIQEFFATESEIRRKELQSSLNKYQEKPECWNMCMTLVVGDFPGVVQFYGAKALYSLLSKKSEDVIQSTERTNEVRNFYVQKLTSDAQSMPHSLLNVLSSGFAVFLLKCLPDIWPTPFTELNDLWSSQPELLLRVLAEVASEFQRLSITWKQKRVVKSELLKVCPSIVNVAHMILVDPASSASVRNAAVECLELWLKIPNARIADFINVFASLFDSISTDIVALARLLSTLKSNEELPNLPIVVRQITQFIALSVCPMILQEVNTSLSAESSNLEDIVPLICSVTEFIQTFIRSIIAHALSQNDREYINIYFSLCMFFAEISNIGGIYPSKECISDLPEPFWTALREELLITDDDKLYAANKKLLRAESVKFFLQILKAAFNKIAFFPDIKTVCDKSEIEQFEAYRVSRGDVSGNSMQIAPEETATIFTTSLTTFLDNRDIFRSESILFCIKEAADFFKEAHLHVLGPVLCRCGEPKEWNNTNREDFLRYGNTLMDLLKEIEHLILVSNRVHEFLPPIIRIILSFLSVDPEISAKAIDTLIVFMKNRDASVQIVLDPIIADCYAYFNDERNSESTRLQSIKAVGIGLSFKPWQYILESLDQILLPRLVSLKQVIDGNASLSASQRKSTVLFELGVMEQLVGTLETNQGVEDIENVSTPVQCILDQCVPLFNLLFGCENPASDVVDKVCDVLRAGVVSLHTSLAPLVQVYLNYLNILIFKYPVPACELAKAVFLAFRSNTQYAPLLIQNLALWYSQHSNAIVEGRVVIINELDDNLLELSYHILKKCWPSLVFASTLSEQSATDVQNFFQSVCCIAVKVIEKSRDISIVRESFRVLALILKNCTESDNAVFRRALESAGERIISATFLSIQSNLVSSYLAQIADILFHFARTYPAQTRDAITKLPLGDSKQTKVMFSGVISLRNFRLQVNEMHQLAMVREE